MKKTLFLITFLLICVLLLSGCGISEETRNEIISILQKEKIINENWNLRDFVIRTSHGITPGTRYYYIYNDTQNKLYAIEILGKRKKEEKEYYSIYVYDDVVVDESRGKILTEEEVETESTTYSYNDGTKRDDNIYTLKNEKEYNIYFKGKSGIESYKVEEYK